MFKKQSKSRKKKIETKAAKSGTKLPKDKERDKLGKSKKEEKVSKNSHYASTISLISRHNASQMSLLDDSAQRALKKGLKINRQSSTSFILKEDKDGALRIKTKSKHQKQQKKSKKNSEQPIPHLKSKKQLSRISPQKPQKKPKPASQPQYEQINLYQLESRTSSEIHFSNSSSVRENKTKCRLTIDCSDELILSQYSSYSRARSINRREYMAAVTIQKVMRGYLTRKVLREFIQREELKLRRLSGRHSPHLEPQVTDYRSVDCLVSARQKYSARSAGRDTFFSNLHQKSKNKKQQEKNVSSGIDLNHGDITIQLKSSHKKRYAPLDQGGLEQQSSIYGQQVDSLSQYIPFDEKYHYGNDSPNFQSSQNDKNSQSEDDSQGNSRSKGEPGSSSKLQEDSQFKSSSQYLKQTPGLSSHASKQKAQDPIPTDFSEKRVQQFTTIAQNTEKQSEKFSNIKKFTKQPQISEKQNTKFTKKNTFSDELAQEPMVEEKNKEKQMIDNLKKLEKQKWNQIIEMLSHQIVQEKSKNQENEIFMKRILELSQKNKYQLEKSCSSLNELCQNSNKKQLFHNKDFILLKSKNVPSPAVTLEQIKSQTPKQPKNEDLPLICKKSTGQPKAHPSLSQKTDSLKSLHRALQQQPVSQLLELREDTLAQKQAKIIAKINEDLAMDRLSHQEFLERLAIVEEQFGQQVATLEQARKQIYIGNRATDRLIRDSLTDAWFLGMKVSFSQSLKDFKSSSNQIWVKQLIVDQLKSYQKPQPQLQQHSGGSQSSSIVQFQQSYEYDQPSIPQGQSPSHQGKERDLYQSLHKGQGGQGQGSGQGQGQGGECQNGAGGAGDVEGDGVQDRVDSYRSSGGQDSFGGQRGQQSSYSCGFEDISYNQGDIQIQNLHKNNDFLDEELNNSLDSDQPYSPKPQQSLTSDHPKYLPHPHPLPSHPLPSHPHPDNESPFLLDPTEQHENDRQVMRKISINVGKKQLHIDSGVGVGGGGVRPRREVYSVDISSQEDEDETDYIDPETQSVVDSIMSILAQELIEDIYINNRFRGKIYRCKNRAPLKISSEQHDDFLGYLFKQIPNFKTLLPKLNQKMTASRLQLLKFMRVTFEDQEESENYYSQTAEAQEDDCSENSDVFEEIGKFQHILSADICSTALNSYLDQQSRSNPSALNSQQISLNIRQQYPTLSSKCQQKLLEREKLLIYNETQRGDLRRQIKKIQFHCIFDALNEILMKKRLKMQGYSGIGLNQLSVIMCRQSLMPMKHQKQFVELVQDSKLQLRELISFQRSSAEKLLVQNYEKLCENDSQWVYYTEEALSFALEFVFMLQDEIFFEETALIFKKMRKF